MINRLLFKPIWNIGYLPGMPCKLKGKELKNIQNPMGERIRQNACLKWIGIGKRNSDSTIPLTVQFQQE